MKTLSRYMLVLGLLVAGAAYAAGDDENKNTTSTPQTGTSDAYHKQAYDFCTKDWTHKGGTAAVATVVIYAFPKLITVPVSVLKAVYNKLSGAVSTAAHDVCEEQTEPETPVQG